MPASKQDPLAVADARDASDLSQPRTSWECAVFDEAAHYAVVEVRHDRRLSEFRVFPWAVRFAREHEDACVYAVSASGRFALLDKEKWAEWEERWMRARGLEAVPATEAAKPHRGTITEWERRSASTGLGFCVEGRMGGRKVLTTSILAQDGDEVETLNWRYTLG